MTNEIPPITVYWRPGCPFCVRLRHGLRTAGVVTDEVNIWEDPSAAAEVRMVANGNETVPTVTVGDVVMVNPSVKAVLGEIERQAPTTSRAPSARPGGVTRVGRTTVEKLQWPSIAALIVLSIFVESQGDVALAWAIDGVNVLVYLVFTVFRWRRARSRRAFEH